MSTVCRTLLLCCGFLLFGAAVDAGPQAGQPSRKALESAAAKGNPLAQYALGSAAEAEGKFSEALSWYQLAANQGYTVAQEKLAELLGAHPGITADDTHAVATTPAKAGSSKPRSGVVDARVTIFVGPQTRDGFVDVDQGVLDSIDDITKELRGGQLVSVVAQKERASMVLDVVSRGATSTNGGGAVAMPIGAASFLIPFGTIGIATILRVGDYEKAIVMTDCEVWRKCAKLVAKDVETWVKANRSRLTIR
jgi:hypothetical protein